MRAKAVTPAIDRQLGALRQRFDDYLDGEVPPASVVRRLKETMWAGAGIFRTEDGLAKTLADIEVLRNDRLLAAHRAEPARVLHGREHGPRGLPDLPGRAPPARVPRGPHAPRPQLRAAAGAVAVRPYLPLARARGDRGGGPMTAVTIPVSRYRPGIGRTGAARAVHGRAPRGRTGAPRAPRRPRAGPDPRLPLLLRLGPVRLVRGEGQREARARLHDPGRGGRRGRAPRPARGPGPGGRPGPAPRAGRGPPAGRRAGRCPTRPTVDRLKDLCTLHRVRLLHLGLPGRRGHGLRRPDRDAAGSSGSASTPATPPTGSPRRTPTASSPAPPARPAPRSARRRSGSRARRSSASGPRRTGAA